MTRLDDQWFQDKERGGRVFDLCLERLFKNTDNAWMDYEAHIKAKPEREKEGNVDRRRQDPGCTE
jgi:hypothetical protein